MDHEEILRRYREEHEDEGKLEVIKIESRIFEYLILYFGILFVGLHYYKKLTPPFEVMTFVSAYLAANTYPRFRFTKKKKYLVETILEAVAAVICFVLFIIS